MKVKILKECGYSEALFGLGLSFGKTSFENDNLIQKDENHISSPYDCKCMKKAALALAGLGGGEDKFLRQIAIWVFIKAPIYWWKQMDTYKVATVAQSESQMHTLLKTPITQECFEKTLPNSVINYLEELRKNKAFIQLENDLPQGWLQGRVVSLNYAILCNIISQRKKHKLDEWKNFCKEMFSQIEHPELLNRIWFKE